MHEPNNLLQDWWHPKKMRFFNSLVPDELATRLQDQSMLVRSTNCWILFLIANQ